MSYFEFIDRMKRMDSYIHSGITGKAEDLAIKLGVSRRTVFEYLSIIKSHGAEVCYDKQRKTFYYKNEFKLIF